MKIKILTAITLIGSLLIISCENKLPKEEAKKEVNEENVKESKQEHEKALEIYYKSSLPDSVKLKNTLTHINHSIELNHKNTAALEFKLTLLQITRDIKESEKTVDLLLDVYNNSPKYLAKKGLYLEVGGHKKKAAEFYNKAANAYQSYFKDSIPFNIGLDYINLLNLKNDTIAAINFQNKMKSAPNYLDFQKQLIQHYASFSHKTNQIWIHYWKKELTLSELQEQFNKLEQQLLAQE